MSQSGPAVVDLESMIQFADKGIVSKTIHQSSGIKLVLFCFEKGQALSEHTAPFEAVIHVLRGTAAVRLGGTEQDAKPGSMFVMPAGTSHALTAKERFVFLLTMATSASYAQLQH